MQQQAKKRKPPLSLVLPDDLQKYLQDKAAAGYRSVTKEITMRLEQSRQAEQQRQGSAHGQA